MATPRTADLGQGWVLPAVEFRSPREPDKREGGRYARPPSEGCDLERLGTEAILWINAVHLQAARIDRCHSDKDWEPSEITAIEVDLHFFLVALLRLRRCVNPVSMNVSELRAALDQLGATFDGDVRSLRKLRNMSEHIDEYNLDDGRDPSVSCRQVQTWAMNTNGGGGLIWNWLGESLDVRRARDAAVVLYRGSCPSAMSISLGIAPAS